MVMSGSANRNKAGISKPLNHQKTVNRKRILIVEDSQLNLRLLVDLLTARHYEILKTSAGLEAINFARDGQPDLILMDVRLPDICGLDVTRLLKHDERTKTIPIIAVTAFAMPDDQKKGLECGCDAYITKPVFLDTLLWTIESFLSPLPPIDNAVIPSSEAEPSLG
jgi:two-component system, cell cycle response regulator DivK